MKDPKEIINILVFLFTAIIIGQLVKVVKKQNIALQLRLERVVPDRRDEQGILDPSSARSSWWKDWPLFLRKL